MNRHYTLPVDSGLLLCLLSTLFLVLPLAQEPRLPVDEAILLLFCFALCSGGMYAFCKRRSGRLGALIAGLVYVYSPVLMRNLAFARGDYSELLAMALFPLLLWRVDALRDRPLPVNFLLAVLLQAVLLHTRQTTALTLTGITLAWLLFETLIQRFNCEASQLRAHSGILAALAVALGVFAGVALWSQDAPASLRAFSGNFLYLEDLLSAPPVDDAGALNGLRQLPLLGPAQWALAGLGALGALLLYIGGYRTRHPQAFLGTAYFTGLALLLISLMQPGAAGLWSGSPLLQGLGAPSQLLALTAACLAIAASTNGLWLSRVSARYRSTTVAIFVAAPIVTVIPLLYLPQGRAALDTAAALNESAAFATGGSGALAAAAACLIAIGIAWRTRSWPLTPRPYWATPALSRTSAVGVLLGGAIALLSLLISYREGVAWIDSPPGQALPAQVQRQYAIGDDVQLLGYDLNADVFSPGDRLVFKAYWYARERPARDYASFLSLYASGPPRLLAGKQHPAGLPASEAWGHGGYIVDRYDLRLPVDLPAGDYELSLTLYHCDGKPLDDCASGNLLNARDVVDAALGGSAVISTIRVVAPQYPPAGSG